MWDYCIGFGILIKLNTIYRMIGLIDGGVVGSRWAVVNGYTEYTSYDR